MKIRKDDYIETTREEITRNLTDEMSENYYVSPAAPATPLSMTQNDWDRYFFDINYIYTFMRNAVNGEHMIYPEKSLENRVPLNRFYTTFSNDLFYTGVEPAVEYSKDKYKENLDGN